MKAGQSFALGNAFGRTARRGGWRSACSVAAVPGNNDVYFCS